MNDHVLMMRKAKEQLKNNWINAAIGTLIYAVIMGVISSTALLELLVVGPLTFGFVLFLACIADTRQANFNLLFKGIDRFVETLIAGILCSIIVGLGMILLIVPGIIAAAGLSLTFFIMIDDPNISGIDALKLSWDMMNGHKWDLFCLWCRFIGWILLCILTVGIGYLWLQPYMTITTLNFYRKLRYGTF